MTEFERACAAAMTAALTQDPEQRQRDIEVIANDRPRMAALRVRLAGYRRNRLAAEAWARGEAAEFPR